MAAALSPCGLGTDSGGSLRVPAHFCGVATLKPTNGLVPVTRVLDDDGPIGALSDPRTQPGPIARSVQDLTLLLGVLAGPDGRDGGVAPVPPGDPAAVRVEGLRVAVHTGAGSPGPTPETTATVTAAAEALAGAGGGRRGGSATWGRPRPHRRGLAFLRPRGEQPGLYRLLRRWDRYRAELGAWMASWDAILTPVYDCPAPPHGATETPELRDAIRWTTPWSLTGWPCAVVRCGTSPTASPSASRSSPHLARRPRPGPRRPPGNHPRRLAPPTALATSRVRRGGRRRCRSSGRPRGPRPRGPGRPGRRPSGPWPRSAGGTGRSGRAGPRSSRPRARSGARPGTGRAAARPRGPRRPAGLLDDEVDVGQLVPELLRDRLDSLFDQAHERLPAGPGAARWAAADGAGAAGGHGGRETGAAPSGTAGSTPATIAPTCLTGSPGRRTFHPAPTGTGRGDLTVTAGVANMLARSGGALATLAGYVSRVGGRRWLEDIASSS